MFSISFLKLLNNYNMINNVNSRRHVDSEKIPSGAQIFSESTCLLEFTLFILNNSLS